MQTTLNENGTSKVVLNQKERKALKTANGTIANLYRVRPDLAGIPLADLFHLIDEDGVVGDATQAMKDRRDEATPDGSG